jgi:chromosome segregation ATPase
MTDRENIDKLGDYGRHICTEAKKGISEGVSQITGIVTMIEDLNKIVDEMNAVNREQQHIIEDLNRDILSLKSELKEKEKYIEKFRIKEAEYSGMEMDSVRLASLLTTIREQEKALEEEQEKFKDKEEAFELDKKTIISEKNDAVLKMKRARQERDDAEKSRDSAVSEKNEMQARMEVRDDIIRNSEKENQKIRGSLKWYIEYAVALDQKIIDYFEGRSALLEEHYYRYLNDEGKIEEIRLHFPDFKKEKSRVSEIPYDEAGTAVEIKKKDRDNDDDIRRMDNLD